ncbi:hypothetical protein RND81_06G167100 [Saponaria officinalis]|uniref:Uncharacterized protein n=1 Tax=Saponaria officinalis TaxID=3572 RepID=A0AAW1KCE9_SAPOF
MQLKKLNANGHEEILVTSGVVSAGRQMLRFAKMVYNRRDEEQFDIGLGSNQKNNFLVRIIAIQYFDKAPSTYSQEMIDKLRERWISYVSRYHQPLNDDDEDDDGQLEF